MYQHQYNNFAQDYSSLVSNSNAESKFCYQSQFDIPLKNKKILDMGCGNGVDFPFYLQREAIVHGIDESVEMIKLARQKFPQTVLEVCDFTKVPYQEEYFDLVCSKWAYQTSFNIQAIYREVHRILKPGAYFTYLVVHPFRQFMEKKKKSKNYFRQEMVKSSYFEGRITVLEPSHTFNEYFCPFFIKNFEILSYEEQIDSASEVIDDAIYPSFFVIKAKKKS